MGVCFPDIVKRSSLPEGNGVETCPNEDKTGSKNKEYVGFMSR